MNRFFTQALIIFSLLMPAGMTPLAARPSGDERDERSRVSELEKEREKELEKIERELARARRERDRAELDEYYEKIAEIERDFADRRTELFRRGSGDREGDERRSGRSEILRELSRIEDERDRELRKIEEEIDRELRRAREEARREGKPEKYAEKVDRLRWKHFEKVRSMERKFAEKRAHILDRR